MLNSLLKTSFTLILLVTLGACASDSTGDDPDSASNTATELTVTSHTPLVNASDVSRTSPISILFNSVLDESTISSSSISLEDQNGVINTSIIYTSGALTITPSSILNPSTVYTVTVETSLMNIDNESLVTAYSWSFTTEAENTTTPLTVTSHTPSVNASDVSRTSAISILFNSALDESTVSASSIVLQNQNGTINASILYSSGSGSGTITITPSNILDPSTVYSVIIETSLKNIDSESLATAYSWSFTTEAANTTTPLTVTSHTPSVNQIDVPVNSTISVVFNSVLDDSSINATSVSLLDANNMTIASSISHSNGSLTITPDSSLEPLTQYTVTLLNTLKNIDGNTLPIDFSWSFTTTLGTPSATGFCDPLPPASGNIITANASQASSLGSIVSSLSSGDTLLLEDGTYELNGVALSFNTPGVTLRSVSGNPENVILDGNYISTQIVTIRASNVTVAGITIARAFTHPIHVTSSNLGDTDNTLIYRVSIIDAREQAIKINPHQSGFYADDGTIACSSIKLTNQGRPNVNPTISGCYTGGIDAHQARGWVVRDNAIEGFWCPSGLSEHAIHFWRGGRDTIIERNILKDNARGIGLGLTNSGTARTYNDNFCPQANGAYIGHYGGIVRNNFIHASSADLLNSASGFDCGVCLASACKAETVHNTIVSTGSNFSSIEWRFAGSTGVEIHNNIVTHPLRERNGASANLSGNLENANLSLFIDGQNGDLHLAPGATSAIDMGVLLNPGLSDFDIDGDTRDALPDIGADEIDN